jgi:hypothetical protein
MTAQQELARLVEEQEKKIHAQINELRFKYMQRERMEGEIVALKESIAAAEEVVRLLEKTREDEEDRQILLGLQLKGQKRGRIKRHKLSCS